MNKQEQIYKFKGKIIRSVYKSEGFSVYALDVDKTKYPLIKLNKYGNAGICGDLFDLITGVEYEIEAIEEDTKYGISYKVLKIRRDEPTTKEETYAFLREILTCNQADTLIDTCPDIISMVKEDRLNEVDISKLKGIGEKSFEKIKCKIVENFYLMDLVSEFGGILSLSMLKKIYDKYSSVESLRKRLKVEPYTTLTQISGIGFKKADAIVIQLQKENKIDFGYDVKTSSDRCLACVLYLLGENENEGNTKANLVDIRSEVIKLTPECAEHFVEAIRDRNIYYNKETMDIALRKTYECEKYIAETILKHIDDNDVWKFKTDKYRNVDGFELSDEQMNILDVVCKNKISILNGAAGCVDCDTEFFDGTKWKRIADYENGDMVLQYNKDETAELVYPERYIKNKADYLWHFETKYGLDQCLSDNHNCYYITSKGNLYHKPFIEVRQDQERNGFRGKFITTFNYSGNGINLSDDEIRLMIATFADGSFYTKEDGEQPNRSRFHIKKERKKERLINLAISTNSNYKICDSVEDGYTDFYIDVLFRGKHFPTDWYNCSKHQLQVIADEVMFWDGDYKNNNNFSTNNKSDADFIQFVFTSLGYRATILTQDRTGQEYETCGKMYIRKSVEYYVNWTKRNLVGLCIDKRCDHAKTKIIPYKTLDGYEYCFTVPSHMLVLRRNDKIFITGNCGKTFSTKALINMLEEHHKSYILLTPTGKSSKVLSENTGRNASTIHRGLQYKPDTIYYKNGVQSDKYNYDYKTNFTINKYDKFRKDIIIVDEFSMVDVSLCKRLFEAINFYDTKLLMIGDDSQLPSVGCGNLFHDFIESNIIQKSTLTKVFRFSEGGLMNVATRARMCQPYLTKDMKSKATYFGDNKDYVFIDLSSELIAKNMVLLYKKLLSNGYTVNDIQVLTSKNVGNCGAIKLNAALQKVANPNCGSSVNMVYGDVVFYEGDSVMQIANEYNAELDINNLSDEDREQYLRTKIPPTCSVFNGDIGRIESIHDNYMLIKFDNYIVRYTKAELKNIKHSYISTIHKSQGSGFKIVILLTPKSDTWMLNSNLIYTGLTRTKEKCFHLGSLNTVNTTVKKRADLSRMTFMKKILKENI